MQPEESNMSMVINNGVLITMNSTKTIYEKGMIIIDEDTISYAGIENTTMIPPNSIIIDAKGGIIMPGLINTHTHIGMSLFRTLADDTADRLKKYLFPLEKQFVTPDLVYWASLYSLIEMIEGGTTTIADMYYYEDIVADATIKAGLRGILGESVLNFPAPDAKEPYGGFAYTEKFLNSHSNHPLITPALAPHAPYSLDFQNLKKTAELSENWKIPILSHLAEMPFEITQIKEEFGMSPVELYSKTGLLNPRMTAAHCIYVNDNDINLLKTSGTGIAHNVVANLKGAKGISPALKMFDIGIPIGLGTDGPMSGNTMDLVNLLGYTAKIHKLANKDRTVMPPIKVIEMATIGGARALHIDDKTGSLEAGKKADLIIVSTDSTSMFPIYDYYSALVYCASPRDVSTVVVNGELLMKNREIKTFDRSETKSEAKRIVAKIKKELKDY
jgi:5-methylthioadenosine/S-adenosylhomocysteine deaminase